MRDLPSVISDIYNPDIGPSPFEYFYVGGDGMSGYSFYGRDVIAQRGYTNGSLTPYAPGTAKPQVTFIQKSPLK